jgi:hypothetical protein
MDANIADASKRLAELSVRAVDEWTGPADYGFEIVGPTLKEPFFMVTVTDDGSIMTDGESVTAAAPGGRVFEELVIGVLEAAVPNDPVLRECLSTCGESTLRTLVATHAERLRDEIVAGVAKRQ